MTRSISRGVLVGLVLSLVSPLPGQNIINVQGGGQALMNAAQGAPPGSIFVLQPGRYSSFPWSVPDATIVAPQRATLVGYFIVTTSANLLTMANIDVVTGSRSTMYGTYPSPGRISSSADLVLDNCTSDGLSCTGISVAASNCVIGADGTTVTLYSCDAVFTDTRIFGGIFFSYYGPFSYAENAMQVRDSTVRMERVSISATSLSGGGINGAGLGLIIGGSGRITIADSQLSGGPAGWNFPAGAGLTVSGSVVVTLSSTTITGGSSGPRIVAPLATAEWTTPGPVLGSTVTARFRDTPATPVAVVLSSDFALFPTPLVAEPLFVFGTPNWVALSLGTSNAQGEYSQSLTIPNVVGLQYRPIWLTGVFLGGLPLRSTAPLGAIIQ